MKPKALLLTLALCLIPSLGLAMEHESDLKRDREENLTEQQDLNEPVQKKRIIESENNELLINCNNYSQFKLDKDSDFFAALPNEICEKIMLSLMQDFCVNPEFTSIDTCVKYMTHFLNYITINKRLYNSMRNIFSSVYKLNYNRLSNLEDLEGCLNDCLVQGRDISQDTELILKIESLKRFCPKVRFELDSRKILDFVRASKNRIAGWVFLFERLRLFINGFKDISILDQYRYNSSNCIAHNYYGHDIIAKTHKDLGFICSQIATCPSERDLARLLKYNQSPDDFKFNDLTLALEKDDHELINKALFKNEKVLGSLLSNTKKKALKFVINYRVLLQSLNSDFYNMLIREAILAQDLITIKKLVEAKIFCLEGIGVKFYEEMVKFAIETDAIEILEYLLKDAVENKKDVQVCAIINAIRYKYNDKSDTVSRWYDNKHQESPQILIHRLTGINDLLFIAVKNETFNIAKILLGNGAKPSQALMSYIEDKPNLGIQELKLSLPW